MNSESHIKVREANTALRNQGRGGVIFSGEITVERAVAFALERNAPISTGNLIAGRAVLRSAAGFSPDNEVRLHELANSIGVELMHRSYTDGIVLEPNFGTQLFEDLCETANIADETGEFDAALKTRLIASTLALQFSGYQDLLPHERRELADETLNAIKDALGISTGDFRAAVIARSDFAGTIAGAIAEAVIVGAYTRSPQNEQGIVTVLASMRQDMGRWGGGSAVKNDNPNFDIVRYAKQEGEVPPKIIRKLQIKYDEATASAEVYSSEIPTIYFKQALYAAQRNLGIQEQVIFGLATLADKNAGYELWDALLAEINAQITSQLFTRNQ